MTTVTITLDEELLQLAEARARELNMTLQDFIVTALREFLASNG